MIDGGNPCYLLRLGEQRDIECEDRRSVELARIAIEIQLKIYIVVLDSGSRRAGVEEHPKILLKIV